MGLQGSGSPHLPRRLPTDLWSRTVLMYSPSTPGDVPGSRQVFRRLPMSPHRATRGGVVRFVLDAI